MFFRKITALCFIFILSGCYRLNNTAAEYERLPLKVLKNPTKEGRACTNLIFPAYLFYVGGDNAIEKARENGGISEIISIENESKLVWVYPPLYFRNCTVVRGN